MIVFTKCEVEEWVSSRLLLVPSAGVEGQGVFKILFISHHGYCWTLDNGAWLDGDRGVRSFESVFFHTSSLQVSKGIKSETLCDDPWKKQVKNGFLY